MRAEMGLPSVKGDDEHGGGMTGGFGGSMGGAQGGKGKRPITVKFEIPYFTTSGIQVRYLKIIEPKVSGPFPCILVFQGFDLTISISVACTAGRHVRPDLACIPAEPGLRNLIEHRCGSPHAGEAAKGGRFRDPPRLTDSAVPSSMCRAKWHMMTHTYPSIMGTRRMLTSLIRSSYNTRHYHGSGTSRSREI